MFCRKCGSPLPDGAVSCQKCGARLPMGEENVNKDKKVLEDKPYLTIKEFIHSPYGESVKKEYKKVNLLCWLAQIVAVLMYGTVIIIMFAFVGSEEDALNEFLLTGSAVYLGMIILQVWAYSRVKKKLTKGSVVCMIIIGWMCVFGAIFGALAASSVGKIEKAYNEYMYT